MTPNSNNLLTEEKRTKNNLIANFIAQFWTLLMGFIFVPIYISYIGLESYGLIGIYSILIAWMGLIDIGMSQTLNREMSRYMGKMHSDFSILTILRTMEWIAFFVGLFVLLIVWAFSDFLASDIVIGESLSQNTIYQSIILMGILVVLRYFEGIFRMSIVGLQKQVTLGFITSSLATVRGVGAIFVLAFVSPTIISFFAWNGLLHLITIIILRKVTYQNLPAVNEKLRFSFLTLKSLWRFTRYDA